MKTVELKNVLIVAENMKLRYLVNPVCKNMSQIPKNMFKKLS